MLQGGIPDGLREHLKGGVSEVAVVNAKGHKFGFVRFRKSQWRFEVEFDGWCGWDGSRCAGGAGSERRRNSPKSSGNIFYCTFIKVVLRNI